MKKKVFTFILVLLSIVIGSFSIVPISAFADSKVISISPTHERIILTPGETFHSGFLVVNPANSKSELHYLATVGTYSVASGTNSIDDYGAADLDTITEMNTVMNWTTIDNPEGTVAINGSETLSYTINVPKDAPAGGQYMTILVREDPKFKSSEGNSSNIQEIMQMGFIVYAEVAGDTRKEGAILENNIPSFLLNNKLEAGSRVRNNGNIHTDAEVVLQVWPLFSDEEICTNEEDASLTFIMPNTERYHVETCELPMVGIFKAKQTVKIFGETSVVEKMIIVCPLWLLVIIIFVIIALITWIVVRVKSRKATPETA